MVGERDDFLSTLSRVAIDSVGSHVQAGVALALVIMRILIAPALIAILVTDKEKTSETVPLQISTNTFGHIKSLAEVESLVGDLQLIHATRGTVRDVGESYGGGDFPTVVFKSHRSGVTTRNCATVNTLFKIFIPQVEAHGDLILGGMPGAGTNGETGTDVGSDQKRGQDARESEFEANHSGVGGERTKEQVSEVQFQIAVDVTFVDEMNFLVRVEWIF